MNQIEKTEIIIGLITTMKSKLIAEFFLEKKTDSPGMLLLSNNDEKIKELEILLRSFYKKLKISDQEYKEILKKIKSYE